MEVAKISSKGQITIPVSVRNKLKQRTGDKIIILEENGRIFGTISVMHSGHSFDTILLCNIYI